MRSNGKSEQPVSRVGSSEPAEAKPKTSPSPRMEDTYASPFWQGIQKSPPDDPFYQQGPTLFFYRRVLGSPDTESSSPTTGQNGTTPPPGSPDE